MVKLRDISYEEFLELFQDKINYYTFHHIIPYYQRVYDMKEDNSYEAIQAILKRIMGSPYRHDLNEFINDVQAYMKNDIEAYLNNLLTKVFLKDKLNFLIKYDDMVFYLKDKIEDKKFEEKADDAIKDYFRKVFNNYITMYIYNTVHTFIKDYKRHERENDFQPYVPTYKKFKEEIELNWGLTDYIRKYRDIKTKEEWKEYLEKVKKDYIQYKIDNIKPYNNNWADEDWRRECLHAFMTNPTLYKKLETTPIDYFLFRKLETICIEYAKEVYGKYVDKYMKRLLKEEVK